MIAVESLPLHHLRAMTDGRGVFEHAEYASPRREHGYCLDDVARALVVTVRHATGSQAHVSDLIETYLTFVEGAITTDGRAHNRMDAGGTWTDTAGLGDWWGRAVSALGFTATHAIDPDVRARAAVCFDRAAQRRSGHLRAMASAAIGASEMLAAYPDSAVARRLLVDALRTFPEPADPTWPWPEPRLRYGNATLAEALIAGGHALGDASLAERGVAALSFLVLVESRDGHLSVTGTAGRGPDELGPQYDQQPIEVAAIADAGARAYELGYGEHWAATVRRAWAWFLGENDGGVPMLDLGTGAGFDGLTARGRNENHGAESTLAALSTGQRFHGLTAVAG